MVQNTGKIKVTADFFCREAVKLISYSTSTEKVGLAALHFARAGAAQGELHRSIFQEPMDFIQNGRNLLNFIDDNMANVRPRRKLSAQQLRILQVAAIFFGF